jgi:uncharacterized membrane protein
MLDDLFLREIGAAVASLLIVGGYRAYVHLRSKIDPGHTIQLVINRARSAWVERMMRDDLGILAVQTLRNSIMVATFFATTAVALVVGTITLSTQSDALRRASETMAASHEGLWFLKAMFLLVDMLCAFFFFSQSIRLLAHVSLMISTPVEVVSSATVSNLLIRAGRYHTRGMRCYYYAAPLLFWLFGPLYLVLASCGLVVALYFLDRSPA